MAPGSSGRRPSPLDPREPLILDSPQPRPVAAGGAWTDDATFEATLCFVETPFRLTVTSRFGEDRVALAASVNVSFGPTQLPEMVGRSS